MAQNELNSTFSEGPIIQSSMCARCGKTAEVHLALLGGAFQQGETFCLSCGEALLRDLRAQYGRDQRGDYTSAFLPELIGMNVGSRSLLHSDASWDDVENGVIFWEGHGWSSDGPFAGA